MSLDHSVASFIAGHHHPALTSVAWAVTSLGSELVLASATVVVLAAAFFRKRYHEMTMVAVAMGGAGALTLGLKYLVHRERPGAAFRVPGAAADSSFAFPSGHTLHTTVFVSLLVALAWPALNVAGRRIACVAATVVALSVAVSRVYLGYHWASDVAGGLVIGAAWAAVVLYWFRARASAAHRVVGQGDSLDRVALGG